MLRSIIHCPITRRLGSLIAINRSASGISSSNKNVFRQFASNSTSEMKSEKSADVTTDARQQSKIEDGPRRTRRNESTVFVRNIPFRAGENELYLLFSKVGAVKDLHVVRDRKTGRYTGYAFCQFVNQNSVEKAKEQLNGYEMYGLKIEVK